MPHNTLPSASRTSLRRRFDQIGIGLAGLCALHCLVALVVVSALGFGGHFLLAEHIHRIGLLLAAGVAAFTIGWGMVRHRRILPFGIAMTGLAVMAAALLVPHGANEFLLTLAGVVLVAAGHAANLRAAH